MANRTPTPIVSANGTLIGVLAGHVDPKEWKTLHDEGMKALEMARRESRQREDSDQHRRGNFSILRCGVSHGSGQKCPCNLSNNKTNAVILEKLNGMKTFTRLAGFTTAVMANWAPDLHDYYANRLEALHNNNPTLKRIFPHSIFASSTYNLGPQTVCHKHTDFANLPFGWCGVTSFGLYDHKKGGHIILWECGLVIEFPPGSTILLPSAVVAHSNTAISEDETRYSFTQYTAGALIQWVENDFQKATVHEASLSKEEKEQRKIMNRQRWDFGLSLVPQIPRTEHPSAKPIIE